MSSANTVLTLSQKQEDLFITKKIGGKEFDICEIQIMYNKAENLELSVKLPLEEEKFISLQEQDLKIWELCDKVKNGMYHEFYFVKNNVLFRFIVDNGTNSKPELFLSHWWM